MQNVKDQIMEAHQFRHACKEFDPAKKISAADFEFILETGRLSPSSFGFEPWKFVVVQNSELRDKLLPVTYGAQKQLPTSSHFVIMLSRTKADLMANSEHIQRMITEVQQLPADIQQLKGEVYHKFLEDDFKLLEHERIVFEWGSRQTYIALGNMMTAAAQIGIDSCPVEGFHKEKVEHILQEEGILTGHFGVACMVAFGYRIQEPRPKTRQAMEHIVEWVD
ncbi:NAD(P)H-dependent oxidoreductase [Paenibacillus sp. 481]|uniref:NAD(P)H-dependent oxidoreductase n=1 Tax=Paenibacillus sp. 481 TaxID=2835869 RepID=UPI001E49D623|nr:NAD(P)H-dependent oxidoreductase [Paenibacillus sp. 481]UHA74664.1 NAD(P)H-dependent oxidoreductase [Paenibacillus sp. 481]